MEDTSDTAKIFAQTKFNGDGIIPPDGAEDAKLQGIINDAIACMGSETDRSGKPGVNQAKVDLFFADAAAYAAWQGQGAGNAAGGTGEKPVLPLGANTPAAAEALKAVAGKVEDYFARCRLAGFDARATAAVNISAEELAAIAAKNLSLSGAEFAGLPLARIEPGRALPLTEGLNPGWRAAMERLRVQVIAPLLGEKEFLTEEEWATLVAKFAPFDAWLAGKAGASVEKLGAARIAEILTYHDANGKTAKEAIGELIARDAALAPEAEAIAQVERLVRYHRDLYRFLNNFVAFRDFYGRREKAIFQAGVLYLDQRSCELCIRVEDASRHGLMAHLSYAYLAYCDLRRKGSVETMTVACAFTAGDSDNLMVGRNGVFYDRQGRDWDATISKIIEQPISIRQAFWCLQAAGAVDSGAGGEACRGGGCGRDNALAGGGDHDRHRRFDTRRAAAGPACGTGQEDGCGRGRGAGRGGGGVDDGVRISPELGGGGAGGGDSVLYPGRDTADFDAFDDFGGAQTAPAESRADPGCQWLGGECQGEDQHPLRRFAHACAQAAPGAHRDLYDVYAERHPIRNWLIFSLVVVIAAGLCWYFGLTERVLPNVFPKSAYALRVQQQKEDAAKKAAGQSPPSWPSSEPDLPAPATRE